MFLTGVEKRGSNFMKIKFDNTNEEKAGAELGSN